jgi:hypothetical protein
MRLPLIAVLLLLTTLACAMPGISGQWQEMLSFAVSGW